MWECYCFPLHKCVVWFFLTPLSVVKSLLLEILWLKSIKDIKSHMADDKIACAWLILKNRSRIAQFSVIELVMLDHSVMYCIPVVFLCKYHVTAFQRNRHQWTNKIPGLFPCRTTNLSQSWACALCRYTSWAHFQGKEAIWRTCISDIFSLRH